MASSASVVSSSSATSPTASSPLPYPPFSGSSTPARRVVPRLKANPSLGGLNLGCCVEPATVIWMLITLLTLTLFLVIFFCTMGVICRWIYRRRMRKKCDALREKYLLEEKQCKADENKAKRLALRPILPYRPRNDNKETLTKLVALQCSNVQLTQAGGPPAMVHQPQYLPSPPPPPTLIQSGPLHPPPPPPPSPPQQIIVTSMLETTETLGIPKGAHHEEVNVVETTPPDEKGKNAKEIPLEMAGRTENLVVEARKKLETAEEVKKKDNDKTRNKGQGQVTVAAPTPDNFPYWSEPTAVQIVDANKKLPVKEVSAWSTSTLVSGKKTPAAVAPTTQSIIAATSSCGTRSRPFRPPNAYELKEYLRTGQPTTSGDDLTQSSRDRLEQPAGPPPRGFAHLQQAALKGLKECMRNAPDPKSK